MQYHVKRIHDYETDVRRIWDHVTHSVFLLLFFLSIAAFDIRCFVVLKFQSTSQVLLLSTFTVFYFILVCIKYLIYF